MHTSRAALCLPSICRHTHVFRRYDRCQIFFPFYHQLVPSANKRAPLLQGQKPAIVLTHITVVPPRAEGRLTAPLRPAALCPAGAIFRRRSPWRGGGPRRRRLRARPVRPPSPRLRRSRPPGPARRRWPGPVREMRKASLPSGRPPTHRGAPGRRAEPSCRAAPPPVPEVAAEGGGGGRQQRLAAAEGSP